MDKNSSMKVGLNTDKSPTICCADLTWHTVLVAEIQLIWESHRIRSLRSSLLFARKLNLNAIMADRDIYV